MRHDQDAMRAALHAFDNAVRLLKTGNLEAAMEQNLRAASFASRHLEDPDCAIFFRSVALSLSDLCVSVRKRQNEVLQIVHQAKDVSKMLGDNRNWALLNLHLGRIYHFLNRSSDAVRLFESGLTEVEKLGDDDIKLQSAEFSGLFHFIHGQHNRALDYLEQAMSLADIYQEGRLFNRMIPIIFGSSAAFSGHFNRAIGVMDSSWRSASLKSDYLSAPFYRAQLGNILLMAGKRKEAFTHLNEALRESQNHKNVYGLVWSQRALAYYFYLENEPERSYEMLKKCLNESSQMGLQKPFYAFPWVLELLFQYHLRGFQPIPACDFQGEINNALKGVNIHLRGTAYRIQAKRCVLKTGHQDTAQAEELLLKSEQDLRNAQVPMGLARTKVEMALLRLRQGRKGEAKELTLQAWEGLSCLGIEFFPPELRPLINQSNVNITVREEDGSLLSRYMNMLSDLVPSADLNELLSRLVALTSKFFKAERGALFLASGSGPKSYPLLQTYYNLTPQEVNGEAFRDSMLYVLKAYRNHQPIKVKRSSSLDDAPSFLLKAILCLPLRIQDSVRGILYHDTRYSEAAFDFSNNTLIEIGRSLGTHVYRIQQYCQNMAEKTVTAIRETTSSGKLGGKGIICHSQAMQEVLAQSDKAARSDAPVLILGETGVGKELLARRVHNMSSRKMGPFVAVNLSAIPEMLLESELFGHEKGSFTGAVNQKPGRMELANMGTLFIDEIGDISLPVQVKLLRALEEKAFFRVGGVKSVSSNFRLVAATNRDLAKEVNNGNFREDLYYRLNVVPLLVPPLRMRGNDVVLLADHFINYYAKKYQKPIQEISQKSQALLKDYRWPGNVRELQNVIERSVILSDGKDLEIAGPKTHSGVNQESQFQENLFVDLPTMDELQRRYITHVIKKSNGKISGAGGAVEVLGMKRTTLYTRMKKLGVDLDPD